MNELFTKPGYLKYSHKNKNGKHIKIEIPWDRTTFLVLLLILLFVGLATGFVESEDIQKMVLSNFKLF